MTIIGEILEEKIWQKNQELKEARELLQPIIDEYDKADPLYPDWGPWSDIINEDWIQRAKKFFCSKT